MTRRRFFPLSAVPRFLDLGRVRRAPRGWVWLVLAAVLLRGLIPVGYMANTSGGPAPFMLCPGVHDALDQLMAAAPLASATEAGPITAGPHAHHHPDAGAGALALAHGGHQGHRAGGEQDHIGPCAFAALAAVAVPLLLLILALPTRRSRQVWRVGAHAPRPRLRLPGTPGARAPPMAA
ncbi:hypothetical protein [Azospirillum sp. B4]|uniref:hypothetical protein n=1 Tax=Azospirillum sp. B4 TaxID=95605 RepID=UPI00034B1373|nr:hypothetical protein [Azospirillum sp. B4]